MVLRAAFETIDQHDIDSLKHSAGLCGTVKDWLQSYLSDCDILEI